MTPSLSLHARVSFAIAGEGFATPAVQVFTDRSSDMVNRDRKSGQTVVTTMKVLENNPLLMSSSSQKTKLGALTCAPKLSWGKEVNIYTDSKHAFGIIHAHGAVWEEQGVSQASSEKYVAEIPKILKAILQPKSITIIHCKVPQKKNPNIVKGNGRADPAVEEAALRKPSCERALILQTCADSSPTNYTKGEEQWVKQLNCTKNKEGGGKHLESSSWR